MIDNKKLRDTILDMEASLSTNLSGYSMWHYGADIHGITRETLKNAIEALKAQEPKVMTLEEVNALDWDYCYLEQERLPGKEYRGMLGKYIMTCVTWPSITAAKISYGSDGYGKRWRCWTSRPTDEQREAEPWRS